MTLKVQVTGGCANATGRFPSNFRYAEGLEEAKCNVRQVDWLRSNPLDSGKHAEGRLGFTFVGGLCESNLLLESRSCTWRSCTSKASESECTCAFVGLFFCVCVYELLMGCNILRLRETIFYRRKRVAGPVFIYIFA